MRALWSDARAWDMGWCDPCAAQPLSKPELRELGAKWVPGNDGNAVANRWPQSSPQGAFVTRLHVRYDSQSFPEDLNFIETSDRENFQARYVLNHPYAGTASCEAGKRYRASLPDRFKHEAENLADLTGWPQKTIAARMATTGQPPSDAN
jgi:hypothetical protein